jgi:hypothetical protein
VELAFVSMAFAGAAFFGALWLASVIWTVRDASRRCDAPSLRIAAAAGAIFLPFLGAAVYAFARPCEPRLEARARRLRMRMLEDELQPGERCAECATPLEPEFRCCVACGERVREECGGCGALVRSTWTVCAWCTRPLGVEREPLLSEVA